MNARLIIAALLAGALVIPTTAIASHTGQYGLNPVEHDSQGRGKERDNHATGVLGVQIVNKVYDPTGTGSGAVADPFPNPLNDGPINPGCTGDAGRQADGQCGLWTVGAGASATGTVVPARTVPPPVSEDGRCQAPGPVSSPPGAYSGTCGAGLNSVLFLDAIQHACASGGGVHYVEVNRKIDDTPLGSTLLGEDFVEGPTCLWAWYGQWTDKNGNGVIDHFAWFNTPDAAGNCIVPCDGQPVSTHFPADEFSWWGSCFRFGNPPTHNPSSVQSGYCKLDVDGVATTMVGWIYPGNHHSYLGMFPLDPVLCALCFYEPIDFPGHQVVNFVGGVTFTTTGGVTAGPCDVIACELNLENLDQADEEFFGDPVFGPQNSVKVDQTYGDRAGDPALTTRQQVYGLGWATWLYDQSILSSLIIVTGVGCTEGGAATYLPATCRFADVDKFNAWNSLVENLVQNTAKGTARSNWVFVRDSYIPINKQVDAVTNNKATTTSDITGPINDAFQDPGNAREPNDAGDKFPAAVFNAAGCNPTPANGFENGHRMFNGWCNNYDAYAAGPRAYIDMGETRVISELRPIVVNTLTVASVAGILLATNLDPEAPAGSPLAVQRADGDHRRTLGVAGKYMWFGTAGRWHDQAHSWDEDIFMNIPELGIVGGSHTNPPDGWVGSIVENLGAWYYRGYADENCGATDKPAWVDLDGDGIAEGHSWAECHPYRDGDVAGPAQDMGAGEQESPVSGVIEFVGACDSISPGGLVAPPAGVNHASGVVTLTAADGVFDDAPILVWRDTLSGIRIRTTTTPPSVQGAEIVDLTGTNGPIELTASCSSGQGSRGPFGASDMIILPLGNLGETITASVTVNVGAETVTDADTYHAWGL